MGSPFRRFLSFFRKPAMIGTPPSQRPAIPTDPAEHAQDFAQRYAEPLDQYCAIRMQELGIPEDKLGADDLRAHMQWCAAESKLVNHEAAVKAAAKTELPVSDGAKRILKAMAR